MKTIEYRIQYTGATNEGGKGYRTDSEAGAEYEVVRVHARDINAGYRKALKRALEPLGNGTRREIGAIEFWQVT